MDLAHVLPPPSFGGRNSKNGDEPSAMVRMSGLHRYLAAGEGRGPARRWDCVPFASSPPTGC